MQDATVVNGGAGIANSGGNYAAGNQSQNGAVNVQQASGFLGANVASGGGNTSNGTASITTGSATAVGNSSSTRVNQSAATGGAGPVDVVVQTPTVINAGAGIANSGGNYAAGNESGNLAVNVQDADGAVAGNIASGGGNTSNGTATIVTGAADAVGNSSETVINTSADTGDDDGLGLDVVVQAPAVINVGLGVANSGLNWAEGNESQNGAINVQIATGLFAGNFGGAGGNTSNGTAAIVTGSATGVGNSSITNVGLAADTGDDDGLDVVVQPAFVLNAGFGLANSGFNSARPNQSGNLAVNFQVVNGVIVVNLVDAGGNNSNGTAIIGTGAANGVGNQSFTRVRQRLA
ncbi:MAG: hypothetical protein M3Z03_05250 [Actinomycetota bacterium]|nr:hypothetical protein [Actinomycetota bacterium]